MELKQGSFYETYRGDIADELVRDWGADRGVLFEHSAPSSHTCLLPTVCTIVISLTLCLEITMDDISSIEGDIRQFREQVCDVVQDTADANE